MRLEIVEVIAEVESNTAAEPAEHAPARPGRRRWHAVGLPDGQEWVGDTRGLLEELVERESA